MRMILLAGLTVTIGAVPADLFGQDVRDAHAASVSAVRYIQANFEKRPSGEAQVFLVDESRSRASLFIPLSYRLPERVAADVGLPARNKADVFTYDPERRCKLTGAATSFSASVESITANAAVVSVTVIGASPRGDGSMTYVTAIERSGRDWVTKAVTMKISAH